MKLLSILLNIFYTFTVHLKRNKIKTNDYEETESYMKRLEVFTQGLILKNGILYESGGLYN
jgi:glutamine cyclotransferase